MRLFAELYQRLDATTKTSRKIAALRSYFRRVAPENGAWAVYFLSGRKLNRLILSRNLQQWAAHAAEVPDWLYDECRETVGDVAETIALLLPPPTIQSDIGLHVWVEDVLVALGDASESQQQALLLDSWSKLQPPERLVFNKLVTGEFRVGVSHGLLIRALAEASGVPRHVVAHRLMGAWRPTAEFFKSLVASSPTTSEISTPYPFCLAHPLSVDPAELGDPAEWLMEWKWDGIRAQLVRRETQYFLWSRGEELITDRFPELKADAAQLPEGTVLDGEIVGWKVGRVLPFADLQRRIGRKQIGHKLLAEVPVRFIAFDLLEFDGRDQRPVPLRERRNQLEELIGIESKFTHIGVSPRIEPGTWDDIRLTRSTSRTRNVEGLMLKRLDSSYSVGRVTGNWWKWKIDPYSCDAVLMYAQRGHGRRASLYTDYTFGVWDQGELVPFAKAYSGLTDEEIREVDLFVRRNTLEKYGPVRLVKPELVFELAFEGIQLSKRHKSGVAVRFPRMARWRRDKKPAEADTLDSIRAQLLSHQ